MSSILPGYEYDIFISYRQKDNRSDQWVTNFVNALREELDATFKNSISIYFDSNPHDGLLETHDVDSSLKEKIKCLIFIPIVSQTYCDPKSFAWQKEFLAFVDFVKQDHFGLDIKLANGNVAKRVLPVRIHEIEEADKSLFEKEIGGVMRSVDFVYKEPGVNRPLKPTDSKSDNQNQTDYANQANKVANAVKELLNALIPKEKTFGNRLEQTIVYPTKATRRWGAIVATILILMASAFYFIYPKMIDISPSANLDKSIAVLPFADMSPNKDQEYLGDGIAEEILNVLAKTKDLKVIGRTSSFSYKAKSKDLKTIGEELGVSTILEGSIRKDGNRIRVTAQFIKAADGSHLWSESYDRELKDIFNIQEELARNISNSLLTTFAPSEPVENKGPMSNEAYNLYLLGKYHFDQSSKNDQDRKTKYYESIKIFKQSIALDSTFANSYAELARVYIFYGFFFGNQEIGNVYDLGEANARKALELDDRNARAFIDMALVRRNRDWDWEASRKYFQKAIFNAPNDGTSFANYAMLLSALNQTDSALYYANKGLVLDPNSEAAKFYYFRSLYYDRQFKKAVSQTDQLQSDRVSFIIRAWSDIDKEKAFSILLNDSDLGEDDKKELKKYYKEKGWEALMKRLYAEYLGSMDNSRILITNEGAPKDVIFEKLNRDADNKVGELVYLLIDPVYDPIRTDPRFDQLLNRMGLDQYK